MRYPVERHSSGFWFVWSMPVESSIDGERRAEGLDVFASYREGMAAASKRNLAFAIEGGFADDIMPCMGRETYREYYIRNGAA